MQDFFSMGVLLRVKLISPSLVFTEAGVSEATEQEGVVGVMLRSRINQLHPSYYLI